MGRIDFDDCAELTWTDFHPSDATALPFDDGSFEFVPSCQVFEYRTDMQAALAESGGYLFSTHRYVFGAARLG